MAKNVILWPSGVKERFNQLLSEVENKYGVSLLLRDQLGVMRDEAGEPLFAKRVNHAGRYCVFYKNKQFEQCKAHCNAMVPKQARETDQPFVALCPGGVAELIVPVRNEMGLVAIIYAGSFRSGDRRHAPKPGVCSKKMLDAYETLPELDADTALGLGLVLHGVGQGFLSELECMATPDDDTGRVAVIRSFVYKNSHQPVTLAALAEALNLSPSRTSHLVREMTGSSFQELILLERIRRAQALLLSTDWPLAVIADRIGFSNAYYFTRQFSKLIGMPPGRFRRKEAGKA